MERKQSQSAMLVDFAQYRVENHVRESLHEAWKISQGRPLNAAFLVGGALRVARRKPSEAFRKLASLFPSAPTQATGPAMKISLVPLDLAAIPVIRPLRGAFSIAEVYFKDKQTIWGRDFITFALFAVHDHSLEEFARASGADIESARAQWLEFLETSQQHRSPEVWRQWFNRAGGTTLPTGDADSPAQPKAYLATWNPVQYAFPKLEELAEKIEESGPTIVGWSTGNRKNMDQGGRVYLLRQGEEPRGLVGVGSVAGAVVEKPHWDPAQRELGKTSRLVDVEWNCISREPFIELSRLVEETGETSLWSSQSGGIEIRPDIVEYLEEVWPTAWERHQQGLDDNYIPDLAPRNLIARLDSDTGGRQDSLNIDRYVNAFARVMASRSLTPPLSIGLFGDWGSGKTFFMERLEERVDELAGETGDDAQLYWPNICQIRFNAWHYAETNLWASLVSTIFNRLRLYLEGDKEDSDEFNKLLQELEVAGELRKAAEQKLATAAKEYRTTETGVNDAVRELDELDEPPPFDDAELRKILKQNIDQIAKKTPADYAELLKTAGELTGRDDFGEAAEKLSKGAQTVDEVRSLIAETTALSEKMGFWWRILGASKLHKSPGFWAVIAVAIAIPAVVFLAHEKLAQFGGWPQIWAVMAEVLTIVGAVTGWIRSRLAKAGPVFDQLNSLQKNIESQIEVARNADRDRYEKSLADARDLEQRARARLDAARKQRDQAARKQAEAERAVANSTSVAQLGRFIRERTSEADYEKHLGIIAMIHRDFERLSKLMERARGNDADSDMPRVDRIVLYIDDLDRCHPPQRVVRVLEAVHLLLFFPLFVVVVGVDSRWVSRALYKHYESMLADESMTVGNQTNELRRAPADSQDFLEKIFQVPFWLRRMDDKAVQRMIHAMIDESEIAASPSAGEIDALEDIDDAMGDPSQSMTDDESVDDQDAVPDESLKIRSAAKRVTTEAEGDPESLGEGLAAPTEALTITQAELDYMDTVAPLMPRTPRSVKRFVNIYRLYKAALSTQGLARFLGTPERPGNFRAVQVLLALVTGTPRLAKKVFDLLDGPAADSNWRLSTMEELLAAAEDEEESWHTTLEALSRFAQGENDMKHGELKAVSYLVSRYSVHHMVSEAPGQSDIG